MIRTLLQLILVAVVVVGLAAFFFGYRWGSADDGPRPAATSGRTTIDTAKAREVGAEAGAAVAKGVNEAERAAANGTVTAKIKAKMALDDRVKAANINVDTTGSVVTLRGHVNTDEERRRAVQLARETDGVTSVADHLEVR